MHPYYILVITSVTQIITHFNYFFKALVTTSTAHDRVVIEAKSYPKIKQLV